MCQMMRSGYVKNFPSLGGSKMRLRNSEASPRKGRRLTLAFAAPWGQLNNFAMLTPAAGSGFAGAAAKAFTNRPSNPRYVLHLAWWMLLLVGR